MKKTTNQEPNNQTIECLIHEAMAEDSSKAIFILEFFQRVLQKYQTQGYLVEELQRITNDHLNTILHCKMQAQETYGKAVSASAAPEATEEAVSKCFRHPSAFVKDKVAEVVRSFYTGSSAELALIEVTLYDHGQLFARSSHKDFVKALVAWGVLETLNDEEMERIANLMSNKYSRLENEGGYLGWSVKTKDRNKCEEIGNTLGPTMPYNRKT